MTTEAEDTKKTRWMKRHEKSIKWALYVITIFVAVSWGFRFDGRQDKVDARQDRQAEQIKRVVKELSEQTDKIAMDTYERCVSGNEVRASIRGLDGDLLDQTDADPATRVEILALAQSRLKPSKCDHLKPESASTTTTTPKEGN